MAKQYETVIGLEVHVELATSTKIFCGCSTKFGAAPNTHTCPVCTGMPGSLPVLNGKVVEYALKLADALSCQVNRYSRFDRKNYFYPDNPQNYQISQLYLPIGHDGALTIHTGGEETLPGSLSGHSANNKETLPGSLSGHSANNKEKTIRIHEMHMEEDAGKLIHDEWEDCSLVDYNRSGVPLIEIVSEPDMRTADEVIAYLEKLRMICQYLGISDCKLQEGSMRADVNLSVREVGSNRMGTRTEMKNLNSFKAIAHAIEGERERQIELLEEGKEVIQETRRWDDNKEYSYGMRSKEDAKDYRYFPDPDLPPVVISQSWLDEIHASRPEFQEEKALRYQRDYGLPAYDAGILTQTKRMADLFEETAGLSGRPKEAANWLMGDTLKLMKEEGMEAEELAFSPEHLASLIRAVDEGKITRQNAKKVFAAMFREDVDPLIYMEEKGMTMVTDTGAVEKMVEQVLADNPKTVEEYHSGKTKVLGFLVGQVMRQMKGKADPGQVNRMLLERL